MAHDLNTLKSVKADAKAEFGKVPGVEGFGIGDDSIRVYVRNADVCKALPAEYQGVTVEAVPTGDITAAGAAGRASAAPASSSSDD